MPHSISFRILFGFRLSGPDTFFGVLSLRSFSIPFVVISSPGIDSLLCFFFLAMFYVLTMMLILELVNMHL